MQEWANAIQWASFIPLEEDLIMVGFQRLDDSVTKVLRVWFHTGDDTRNVPYRQMQPALGFLTRCK
jgi:hypothetical protein